MEESRCKNCIWYEDCKKNNDMDEFCEYLDQIEEDDPIWEEMSYNKYRKEND